MNVLSPADALDYGRLNTIAELADLAASYWYSVALAATRGERLTIETHCRQIAAVTREAFGPPLLRSVCGGLPRPAPAHDASARETEQHHRPSRRFGYRAANSEVETKAAGPVSSQRVANGQIDIGAEVGAQIDDVIVEETLGNCQASERRIEDFGPSASMVNSIDSKPAPDEKPVSWLSIKPSLRSPP